MQLYSFCFSSTSYRVRIALALKGIAYNYVPVNLRAGDQRAPDYLALNPSGSVPLLVMEEGHGISQSLAIIDYLDATCPEPRLIPEDPVVRARVMEIANVIGCDIHPINNLRVLAYLKNTLHVTDDQKSAWYRHWVEEGMVALEALLNRDRSGPYCVGQTPTLANCCLIPQVHNAMRMGCNLQRFRRVLQIYWHCQKNLIFRQAEPANQIDYSD